MKLSRASLCRLVAGAGFATAVPIRTRAAAPLVLRCGTDTQPTQVMTQSVNAMAAAIEKASNGDVKLAIYPASILGTADAMASQLRNGALDFALISGANLGGIVSLCNIEGVGFAFSNNAEAYRAMDGPLGQLIRKQLLDTGIYAFDRVLGAGFTQFMNVVHPIRTPADLAGLKMRTPTSRVIINLMQTLGGSPAPIALAEVYTSLQTHLVDGIVITLDGFEGAHLYEVQKYISVLNPVWAGRYFLASASVWNGLPHDVSALVSKYVTEFALSERERIDNSEAGLLSKLTSQGMVVIRPDAAPFKAKCGAHYAWCKSTFGEQAWAALEQTAGTLT